MRMELLCVQWKSPDDGQRNCPKHVESYPKNKFEKLLHLVGFIVRIYHDARSPERQNTEPLSQYIRHVPKFHVLWDVTSYLMVIASREFKRSPFFHPQRHYATNVFTSRVFIHRSGLTPQMICVFKTPLWEPQIPRSKVLDRNHELGVSFQVFVCLFVCLFICLFVFGATVPQAPWPPHSHGF